MNPKWTVYPSRLRDPSYVIDLAGWMDEVANALTQLTQEVHALNPGVSFEFNMDIIRAPIDGQRVVEHDDD